MQRGPGGETPVGRPTHGRRIRPAGAAEGQREKAPNRGVPKVIVVFLEDVDGVALGGDVREVKNGFARNYLIPKKLAVAATPSAMQRVAQLQKKAEEVRLRTVADMRAVAEMLEGVEVAVPMRAGAGGKLYGSVTTAIVAKELSVKAGREIDRRAVAIAEPIRDVGVYDVSLRLHADVKATVSVIVYPEGTDPAELRRPGEAPPDERGSEEEGEPDAHVSLAVATGAAGVASDTAEEEDEEPEPQAEEGA